LPGFFLKNFKQKRKMNGSSADLGAVHGVSYADRLKFLKWLINNMLKKGVSDD
jgi:hypothetical protein